MRESRGRVLRQTLAIAEPRNIAIIEEDDMNKTTWQDIATDAAQALTATDCIITGAKDGLLASLVGALSEGETAGTWRLAIEVAMGYEHKLYDAGTNAMITCDGAKVPATFAFVSAKRRGPIAYLHWSRSRSAIRGKK
jgi:hypothetical protein